MSRSAKEAVDQAMSSSERVARQAKRLTATMVNRVSRTRTNPFLKAYEVEKDEEDSLVTSIENVIATAKKEDE